jgi:hypothetical protein
MLLQKKQLSFRTKLVSGIDHMSAMKVIDEIRDKGGKMFCSNHFVGD